MHEFIPDPSRAFAFSCGPGITPHERKAAKAAGEELVPRFVENMVELLQKVGLNKKQIKKYKTNSPKNSKKAVGLI